MNPCGVLCGCMMLNSTGVNRVKARLFTLVEHIRTSENPCGTSPCASCFLCHPRCTQRTPSRNFRSICPMWHTSGSSHASRDPRFSFGPLTLYSPEIGFRNAWTNWSRERADRPSHQGRLEEPALETRRCRSLCLPHHRAGGDHIHPGCVRSRPSTCRYRFVARHHAHFWPVRNWPSSTGMRW